MDSLKVVNLHLPCEYNNIVGVEFLWIFHVQHTVVITENYFTLSASQDMHQIFGQVLSRHIVACREAGASHHRVIINKKSNAMIFTCM